VDRVGAGIAPTGFPHLEDEMRLLVASLKGGSGKSTLSFNLAVRLAYRGPVRLYDLDPQATLTDVCELRRELGVEPALDLRDLADRESGTDGDVLYDSSFSAADALYRAAGQVDAIVLPVGPSQADVWSAQRFLDAFDGRSRPPVLAFINRADTHVAVRESDDAAMALKQLPGLTLLAPRLSQRTAFRRSLSEALAVFELDPGSKAAEEFEILVRAIRKGVSSTRTN
jgi:plasmid segregation oscillating ATPase ParF